MPESARGKLKIYMGYAAGVGKTYKMLEEAQALHAAGRDVVIGYFESHGRADTIARTEGLETVPRRGIEYRGTVFEEMDTGAVLARHPEVAVVDEFPHTNVPGSDRAKRWEDVEALLAAGIDVLTTMNIQHLESLNDQVSDISGIRVRETIPDWVVERAAEVVMIDLTPLALLHRLERGAVYPKEKAERAKQNFFRETTLVALRELALRQAAHEVQSRSGSAQSVAAESMGPPGRPPVLHRILVLITAEPETAMVVRRAARMAGFLHADCLAVAIDQPSLSAGAREALDRHLNFARNLHIQTRVVDAGDVAQQVIEFARRNGVTQIYLARPPARRWLAGLARGLVQQIVAAAKDLQIVIVSGRDRAR
jgi:two-component system, OmpR family, sensor histidine kinase KdpD